MDGSDDQVELVRRSGLFDPAWYVREYPDVATLGIDPVEHYLKVGAALLRDPCEHFSTRYYLRANPEVAAARINPLIHFSCAGQQRLYFNDDKGSRKQSNRR